MKIQFEVANHLYSEEEFYNLFRQFSLRWLKFNALHWAYRQGSIKSNTSLQYRWKDVISYAIQQNISESTKTFFIKQWLSYVLFGHTDTCLAYQKALKFRKEFLYYFPFEIKYN